MLKSLIFSVLILSTVNAFSQEYLCTKWKEQRGVSCIFAGRMTKVWARKCENTCNIRMENNLCDLERLCFEEDPNFFEKDCSKWVKEKSTICHNPSTGDWEQKWVRACQKNMKTTWCSDENPNR